MRPVTIEDTRVVTHGAAESQVQEQGFTAGLSTPQATPMLLTGQCVACGENWLKDGMREHPCGDPRVSVPKLMARLATAEAERDRLREGHARRSALLVRVLAWYDAPDNTPAGAWLRPLFHEVIPAIRDELARAPSTGGTP